MQRIHPIDKNEHEYSFLIRFLVIVIPVVVLVGTFFWRMYLLNYLHYNPDEFFYLGAGYRVANGLMPIIDFPISHAPFFFVAISPIVDLVGPRADFLDVFRLFQVGATVLFLLTLFFLVRKFYDTTVALFSLMILQSFEFFTIRTVQFRPDMIGYVIFFIGLFLFLSRDRIWLIDRKAIAGAAIFGFGFSCFINLIVPFSGLLLWVLLEGRRNQRTRSALKTILVVTGVFLAAYLLTVLFVFGKQIFRAYWEYAVGFAGMKTSVSFDQSNWTIAERVISRNPFSWAFLLFAILVFHWRWFSGREQNAINRFFAVFTDFGFLFMLLIFFVFEQHYFFVLIGGSVLAASLLGAWLQQNKLWVRVFGLCVLLLFPVFSVRAINESTDSLALENAEENYRCNQMKMGALRLGGVSSQPYRNWLQGKPDSFFAPFHYKTKEQQIRQIDFILRHSSEQDTVLSDYFNPPYRELPTKVMQGWIINRIYRINSEFMENNLWWTRKVYNRYDPYYSLARTTQAEHMLNLLQRAEPRLVLLDGSYLNLFTRSDEIHQFVSDNYRIQQDADGCVMYAVHR